MKIITISLVTIILTACITKTRQPEHNIIVVRNDSIPSRLDTLHLFFPLKQAGSAATINASALDTFSNIWYSRMLIAMQEPILSGHEDEAEIYRFTWLRSFHHLITVRIERRKNSFSLTTKMTEGKGGYAPGKLIMDKTIVLNQGEWKQLNQMIADINFLSLPSIDNGVTGTDGSEWILEHTNEGLYHFTVRWTPELGSNYGKCGLYFLSLAGFNITGEELY